ncbi:MAG: GNAT family protein [Verrucomicrobiota bacterium]
MRLELSKSIIRRWETSDAASLVKYANDYDIWKNLRDGFPHPYTLSNAEFFLQEVAPISEYSFAVEVNGEAIGGIGGKPQEYIHSHCIEIGYWLGQEFRGRGIMSEVIAAFSDALLNDGKFVRLFALPFANNPASHSTLEKAGFHLEGITRKSAVKEGIVLDQYVYVKLSF